jgi:hypothetical protein
VRRRRGRKLSRRAKAGCRGRSAAKRRAGEHPSGDWRLAFNLPTDRYAAGEIVPLWRDRPTASPDPAADRTHMSTREALAMPAEERYRQLEASADVRVRTQNEPQPHWTITSDAPASRLAISP